jgi:hypothetical protein
MWLRRLLTGYGFWCSLFTGGLIFASIGYMTNERQLVFTEFILSVVGLGGLVCLGIAALVRKLRYRVWERFVFSSDDQFYRKT